MGRGVESGAKRRMRVALAKRLWRGLRDGEEWAEKMLKRERWTREAVEKWARGEYRTKSNKKSYDQLGEDSWKRRFGEVKEDGKV